MGEEEKLIMLEGKRCSCVCVFFLISVLPKET